jgi:Pyruvate/2-oxoacid:ferredoxin oxidoreductase gamma subunit
MVPPGAADFVLLLASEARPRAEGAVEPTTGVILDSSTVAAEGLAHRRCLNVALLGVLAELLPYAGVEWEAAVRRAFRPDLREVNLRAFRLGRRARRVA